jgi:hypothetical protein
MAQNLLILHPARDAKNAWYGYAEYRQIFEKLFALTQERTSEKEDPSFGGIRFE